MLPRRQTQAFTSDYKATDVVYPARFYSGRWSFNVSQLWNIRAGEQRAQYVDARPANRVHPESAALPEKLLQQDVRISRPRAESSTAGSVTGSTQFEVDEHAPPRYRSGTTTLFMLDGPGNPSVPVVPPVPRERDGGVRVALGNHRYVTIVDDDTYAPSTLPPAYDDL
ncbi:hypothetical protein NM688_g4818 [Phlebia brevispora]|uniref:Uncharacterized protein n=1 Tax=Phlebia brevispora TaxID=194682 RepID=A0ACC1T1K0_9APHY|nr:hypothetical protein NM688_g4818 [Phlebia brevispora]